MSTSIIAGDFGTPITIQNKTGPKKIDPPIDLTGVTEVSFQVKKPNPNPMLPGTSIETAWIADVSGDPTNGYITYTTEKWAQSDVPSQTGVLASIEKVDDPRVKDEVRVKGLTGMSVNSINRQLILTSADNAGQFWITGYESPSAVRVVIPGIISGEKIGMQLAGLYEILDSHNGAIHWKEVIPAGGDTDVPGKYVLQPRFVFDGLVPPPAASDTSSAAIIITVNAKLAA